jgi:Uma2 family endonuclease
MIVRTAEKIAELMPDATQLYSDEPEMESSLHYAQLAMLVSSLEWYWRERNDYFIGANLTIYFSRQQLKTRDFRGPDFFLVKGTNNAPRTSWVVWEEGGKYPNLIIELLSDSTADIDRDIKKEIYQDRFRTPEYFWFSPITLEFSGLRLQQGKYQGIVPNEQGWCWSEELQLYLGVAQGQLRYFTAAGALIPTLEEGLSSALDENRAVRDQVQESQGRALVAEQSARLANLRADEAEQRAEQEAQRAERLATKLRELGIDPNQL